MSSIISRINNNTFAIGMLGLLAFVAMFTGNQDIATGALGGLLAITGTSGTK